MGILPHGARGGFPLPSGLIHSHFESMRYARQEEFLPVYRHWDLQRTAVEVDTTIPFSGWTPAMWLNLSRRVELDGAWLFGLPSSSEVKALDSAPSIVGTDHRLRFESSDGSQLVVIARNPSEEYPHIEFPQLDGAPKHVTWDSTHGQDAWAAKALLALTGVAGRAHEQMAKHDGYAYTHRPSSTLCRVLPVMIPGLGWGWKVIWANVAQEQIYFIFALNGTVVNDELRAIDLQPSSDELGAAT